MKLLLLTATGSFSTSVLRALIEQQLPPDEVIVHGAGQIPLRAGTTDPETDVAALAAHHGLACRLLDTARQPAAVTHLASRRCDVLLVACFPHVLPPAITRWPRLAAINLHPAALPAWRGPAPVFWQLRAGAQRLGITLHRLEATFDTGAIYAQDRIPAPAGASWQTLHRLLAERGVKCLHELMPRLAQDRPRPQDNARASTQSFPRDADFTLSARWSARRAYNFMCGTRIWGRPYPLSCGGAYFLLDRALDFDPRATSTRPWCVDGDELVLRFARGVLRARRLVNR